MSQPWPILLLLVLAAGCASPAIDPVDTFGPRPSDDAPRSPTAAPSIPSPSPTTAGQAPTSSPAAAPPREPTAPAGPVPAWPGQVVGPSGEPVPGARLWVEAVDSRSPVNHTDAYVQMRDATLVEADANGSFALPWREGAVTIAVAADGWIPRRVTARAPDAAPVIVRLAPGHPELAIAHRGAASYGPENTLGALRKAAALGLSFAEIDVRTTRDGVLVLLHDETLDRTTDGSGAVADRTYEEVRRLDAGSWFHASFAGEPVPRLRDALLVARDEGLLVQVEIKGGDAAAVDAYEAAVALAKETGTIDIVRFTSFLEPVAARCGADLGRWCGYITREEAKAAAAVNPAAAALLDGVFLRRDLATSQRLELARASGIDVWVWGTVDAAEAVTFIEEGAAGVSSDDPLLLYEALSRQRLRAGGAG